MRISSNKGRIVMKKNFNILLVAPYFLEKWNKLDLVCKENLAISSLASFLDSKGFNVFTINALGLFNFN